MSDHISGPRALADPIADITDVYAFPSPERPGHLVLVMNTLPFAPAVGPRSRTGSSTASGCARSRRPAGRPGAVRRRRARSSCSTASSPPPSGDASRSRAGGHLHHPGRRDRHVPRERRATAAPVTACACSPASRWDPFIMDAPAALKTIATGRAGLHRSRLDLPRRQERPQPGRRDRLARCSSGAELVGVVAETLTRGTFNVRIERVGRPEVKNMMLAPKQFDQVNRDLEIRDLYNMEDAFHLGDGYLGAYRARLNANLRVLGRPRRDDRLADERRRRPPADRARARRLPRRRRHQAVRRAGLVPRDRARRPSRRGPPRPAAAGRSTTTSWTRSSPSWSTPATGRSSATASTTRPGRPRARFPYLAPPNPDPPDPPEHHH